MKRGLKVYCLQDQFRLVCGLDEKRIERKKWRVVDSISSFPCLDEKRIES